MNHSPYALKKLFIMGLAASGLLLAPISPLTAAITKPAIPVEDFSQIKVTGVDPSLEASIIEILQKKHGITVQSGNLTAADFQKLGTEADNPNKVLDLSNKGIERLDGLEFADNVECLVLANNKIHSVLPLLGLDNLKAVNLDNNLLKETAGAPQMIQVLKGSLVFVYEGSQKPFSSDAFLTVSTVLGQTIVTVNAPKGEIFELQGLSSETWVNLLPPLIGDGQAKPYAVNPHLKYRLLPVASRYMILNNPADNKPYHHYLSYCTRFDDITIDSLSQHPYNQAIGNYEGLWPNDARDWYHNREKYFYDMIPGFDKALINDYLNHKNSSNGGKKYVWDDSNNTKLSNIINNTQNDNFEKLANWSKSAFELRVACRKQARLLMANQLIADQVLGDRTSDFNEFFHQDAVLKLTFGELTQDQIAAIKLGDENDYSNNLKATRIKDLGYVKLKDLNDNQLDILNLPNSKHTQRTNSGWWNYINETIYNKESTVAINSGWFSNTATDNAVENIQKTVKGFVQFDPNNIASSNTDLTKEQTAKTYLRIIESSTSSNDKYDWAAKGLDIGVEWIRDYGKGYIIDEETDYVPLPIIEQNN